MDRWGFEPQAFAMPRFGGSRAEYKVNKSVVAEYFEYRLSRVKAEKSHYWIKKSIMDYLKFSKYKIDRDSLMRFQNWYKSKYEFEGQAKYHSNLRNFLEWLYKKTGNHAFRELKDILEPPKKDSKKLNPILIREPDIHNLIKAVWEKDPTPYLKLKHITGILFAAYTGQRPDSTIAKITVDELRETISRDPPVLWIPEEKDKERFPHWVPIHPVLREWLQAYIEHYNPELEKEQVRGIAFSYYSMRKLFDRLNIKAIHTGRKITYSHLRKFFEQMCNNVLMVHPGLRDYIMAHNTGSLDVQSYDGKLPSEIYGQYMVAWGKVNLAPEEVKLEVLLNRLKNLEYKI
ncbi:hypothetical protein [Archaeoglobus sp.]